MYMLQVKIIFMLTFLTLVDSQFPLSPSPNYSWVRTRRERKLRINLGKKIFNLNLTSLWRSSRDTLAAGREKEGELTTTVHLWNLNSTSNSPEAPCRLSCQISNNQHKVDTSTNGKALVSAFPKRVTNVNKHWKAHAKGNDIITDVLMSSPPISVSHQFFQCRYSGIPETELQALLPFPSRLLECPGELAPG